METLFYDLIIRKIWCHILSERKVNNLMTCKRMSNHVFEEMRKSEQQQFCCIVDTFSFSVGARNLIFLNFITSKFTKIILFQKSTIVLRLKCEMLTDKENIIKRSHTHGLFILVSGSWFHFSIFGGKLFLFSGYVWKIMCSLCSFDEGQSHKRVLGVIARKI